MYTKSIELKEYQLYLFLSDLDVSPEILNIEKLQNIKDEKIVKFANETYIKRSKMITKKYNYQSLSIQLTTKKYLEWFKVKNKIDFEYYKNKLLDLLDIIHKSRIYHHDIYEDNVVFDIENEKNYFIDFGLSGYFSDLYMFSKKEFEENLTMYWYYETDEEYNFYLNNIADSSNHTEIFINRRNIIKMEQEEVNFLFKRS